MQSEHPEGGGHPWPPPCGFSASNAARIYFEIKGSSNPSPRSPNMIAKTSAVRRKVERKEPEKPLLLDPVFAAIRKLAGKTRQEDAAAFAQAFYHRMDEDELPLHTPEGWA